MSRVLKVSEDNYRIKVKSSGTIHLDTGTDVGTVYITGDLVVQGETTTISTTQTTIEDRIITLNKSTAQDVADGIISLGGIKQSGIEINRGTRSRAQLLFDENVNHYDPVVTSSVAGTFVLRTADGVLSGVRVASISPPDSYDMVFDMQNSLTKLKIVNITPANYVALLDNSIPLSPDTPEDNFIPNKKYVNSYVSATGGVANVDNFHYLTNPTATRGQAYSNYIKFTVATQERARITPTGLEVDNINLFGDTISNKALIGDDKNLILTATNSKVEIDAVLQIDDTGLSPGAVTGATKIYTVSSDTTPAPGKTGIFFTNLGNSDELVAKNRALLFSILF